MFKFTSTPGEFMVLFKLTMKNKYYKGWTAYNLAGYVFWFYLKIVVWAIIKSVSLIN